MPVLRAALVTPLSGPLALYGRASAAALCLWAKQAAQLPAGYTGVTLDVYDSEADALQAMLSNYPDVVFGPYGSGPMLRVARSCTRLIWNHGGANSRLAQFPHVINVLSPASMYFASALRALHTMYPALRTVSLFHSATGFGRDVAAGAQEEAQRLQMSVQSVAFPSGQASARIGLIPPAECLLVVGNFADEQAIISQVRERAWRFVGCVGAGVEEVLTPEQREGLLGPAQWVARTALEPDEGPDARWFVTRYRQEVGSDPPYAAAQAFAAGIVYARCLRETGNPDEKLIQAAAQRLTCRTLFGAFRLEQGKQVGHQVVLVQWQQGQRRVVWPLEQAERPLYSFR